MQFDIEHEVSVTLSADDVEEIVKRFILQNVDSIPETAMLDVEFQYGCHPDDIDNDFGNPRTVLREVVVSRAYTETSPFVVYVGGGSMK